PATYVQLAAPVTGTDQDLIIAVLPGKRTQEYTIARTVHCIKQNKEAEGLDIPPDPDETGKKHYLSIPKDASQAWLKHQTMLINENRLNLADDRARKYLATQMEKHFFGEGADAAVGYVPPTA